MSDILSVRDLSKGYEARGPAALPWSDRRLRLVALDGVSLDVAAGEALAVVGESGCGKSTLARCIVGLEVADGGTVAFEGRPLARRRSLADRRGIQIVFQDPASSLNPSMTVGAALAEVLSVHRIVPPRAVRPRALELLARVGLDAGVADALPRSLSGGQKQRVGIARALAVEPRVLIADEPVSALDVSVQATVLNLLADLRRDLGLTLVLISHDLGIVRHVCDRVAVMYLGRIVEVAPTEELFETPRHPYARRLIAAAPTLERRADRARHGGADGGEADELPSSFALPSGCRYRTRCPEAREACAAAEPRLAPRGPHGGRSVACHFA